MAHVVNAHYFTTQTARDAVNKRWERERAARSPAAIQKRIREYFEKVEMDPDTADPNIALAVIMNDPSVPSDVRVVAAKTLQPYYHGPALTAEQVERADGYLIENDPELASKRRMAYDFVLKLVQQSSTNGPGQQPAPAADDASDPANYHPFPEPEVHPLASEVEVLDPMLEPDGSTLAKDVTPVEAAQDATSPAAPPGPREPSTAATGSSARASAPIPAAPRAAQPGASMRLTDQITANRAADRKR